MPPRLDLPDAVLVQAVQMIEERGPLDDVQAMREAAAGPDAPRRAATRARQLAGRLGLLSTIDQARQLAPWMALAFVAAIVLAALALAAPVTHAGPDGERRINVVVALAGLLGVHLLTLVAWMVGLLLPAKRLPASIGSAWLGLTARVAGGRKGQSALLLGAVTRLLARAGLVGWSLGFISHLVWTLSFTIVTGLLLFALAFRNYTLGWETTILQPDFFVQAVTALGWLPAQFGFPVPQPAEVLQPMASAASQRAWALWLTGCLVCYGLLPRVLLMLLCAGVWRARRGALQPDWSAPDFVRLEQRFEAMRPPVVLDADGRAPASAIEPAARARGGDAPLWIAFECPPDIDWPPPSVDPAQALRVDGSAESLDALHARLATTAPARIVVHCMARSSPDRGTERLLRELRASTPQLELRLVAPSDAGAWQADPPALHARWRDWLASRALIDDDLPVDAPAARTARA